MITARPQKDLKAAKNYFRKHLAQGDYYSENRTIQGCWFGKGAERLGLDLAKPVAAEAYDLLCENRHPLTGEHLTLRQRRDRRVFFDFVASAPKSVSIMALVAEDHRIAQAHAESCRAAFLEMEKVAAVRIRRHGARGQRPTGEIVAAVFEHQESRALDPQLHTHFVIFNATWDSVENRWKALEPSDMFDRIKLYTEVYRSNMAVRLQAIGYRLRPTTNGFEIEGVSPAIIELFSRRHQAIVQAEAVLLAKINKEIEEKRQANALKRAAQAATGGNSLSQVPIKDPEPITRLTNNARAEVSRATRAAKRSDLTPQKILADQRSRLSTQAMATLRRLRQSAEVAQTTILSGVIKASTDQIADHHSSQGTDLADKALSQGQEAGQGKSSPRVVGNAEAARAAIDYARDHLFERNSAVPRHDLLREALQFGRGAVNLPALEAELQRRTEFILVDGTLTTREALRQEQRMVALVNQGLGGCEPLRPDFLPRPGLTAEQRQALEFMLRSPDEVIALRGLAGTGKTRLLQELLRAIEERYSAVVLAPRSAAVEVLREQGFKQAATVRRFLIDPEFQRSAKGKALIVDEAGVLSLRELLSLIETTRASRCRLILSGDARQHSGIEAGDALRVLEKQSFLRTVELRNIQRQVNREYREAISELAEGKGQQALRRLERLGAVEQLHDEVRYHDLAGRYVASIESGKSALIVSPTWREIKQVTTEVRGRLKNQNLLGPQDVNVPVHEGLKWTRAEKRDLRNYKPGMVLTFHKATKDFCAGEWAELKAVEGERLRLLKPDGKAVSVTRKQSACFEVATQEQLPVAAGERLLLQGNRKQDKLYNGQIVTVKQVLPAGDMVLTDGRRMPADFRAFTHGYCVTSHASQGRTVDHVYVAVDSHTLNAANLKQFYVSTSRGREQVRIYTDDREFLSQVVTKPGHRMSATELVEIARLSSRQAAEEHQTRRQRIRL